jgi:hypothetical protein
MTDAIQASLHKLHSLSEDLNKASDILTAELNSVETALNKLKLGVSAFVRLRQEDAGDGYTRIFMFGYYKLKGKWGLVHYEYIEGFEDDDDRGLIFLRDAPRDMRILAGGKLAELITKIAENAAETTKNATLRAKEAKEIATSLSKGRT